MLAALKLDVDESNEIDSDATSRSLGSKNGEIIKKLEESVKETLSQGRVGLLNVDPKYYVLEPQSCMHLTLYLSFCFVFSSIFINFLLQ